MKLAKAALLLTLASAAAWAQVNAGEQKPEASLPFTMTTVTTFEPALAAGLPARWPHADHRKGRARLAGDPAGTEDPGRQYAPGLLAGPERHAGRLPLAPLRHRPEYLSHLCRAG